MELPEKDTPEISLFEIILSFTLICDESIMLIPFFVFLILDFPICIFSEFMILIPLLALNNVRFAKFVFFAFSNLIESEKPYVDTLQFLIVTSDAPLTNIP